jgi:hypothetical protein
MAALRSASRTSPGNPGMRIDSNGMVLKTPRSRPAVFTFPHGHCVVCDRRHTDKIRLSSGRQSDGLVACSRFLRTSVLTFNVFQQLQITCSNVPMTTYANRNNQIIVPRCRVMQKTWRVERSHGWMSLFPRRLSFSEMLDASTIRMLGKSIILALETTGAGDHPLLTAPAPNWDHLRAFRCHTVCLRMSVKAELGPLDQLPERHEKRGHDGHRGNRKQYPVALKFRAQTIIVLREILTPLFSLEGYKVIPPGWNQFLAPLHS